MTTTITYLGLDGYNAKFKTTGSGTGLFGKKSTMDEVKLMNTIQNWDKETPWEQASRVELLKGFNAIRAKKIANGVSVSCDVDGYIAFRP